MKCTQRTHRSVAASLLNAQPSEPQPDRRADLIALRHKIKSDCFATIRQWVFWISIKFFPDWISIFRHSHLSSVVLRGSWPPAVACFYSRKQGIEELKEKPPTLCLLSVYILLLSASVTHVLEASGEGCPGIMGWNRPGSKEWTNFEISRLNFILFWRFNSSITNFRSLYIPFLKHKSYKIFHYLFSFLIAFIKR